ncbi:conjugal transfer protein TraG [Pseudoflavonifractor sp. 524-17]|nr:conjugal transfer protein TraG [Pseudoflavonifractor sp. 524-17]
MKPDVKKIIITNLPYLLFVWLFGKMGEAWRLAAGADASQKMLHFMDSLAAAFANGLPSFHPLDLCIGVAGAALVRLAVYLKGKNAKKYRHGMEYGSARWSA